MTDPRPQDPRIEDEIHHEGDAPRRTHLANERTFLAWWRSGLAAITVGFGVGKFGPAVGSKTETWAYVAIGAAFIVLGGAFVLATSGQELKERFFSIKQHDVDESANMRKRAWKAAFEIATEKPFFGVGPRCSAPHMEEHGANSMMAIHNQYLQLAADTGGVGMGVYLALYASALFFGFRLWWKIRKWPDYPEVRQARSMAAGITCALILYGIGASFLSLDTFELPYVLFLLMAQLWNCYKGGGIEAAVRVNGSVPSHDSCWKQGVSRMSIEWARAALPRLSCHWSGTTAGNSDQSFMAEVAGSTRDLFAE